MLGAHCFNVSAPFMVMSAAWANGKQADCHRWHQSHMLSEKKGLATRPEFVSRHAKACARHPGSFPGALLFIS